MYYIGDYGVKHYRADTYADIANIDISTTAMGSTVFVIDTSTYYMLNGAKQWVTVTLGNTGGGSDDTDTPSHVIYEGGGV